MKDNTLKYTKSLKIKHLQKIFEYKNTMYFEGVKLTVYLAKNTHKNHHIFLSKIGDLYICST